MACRYRAPRVDNGVWRRRGCGGEDGLSPLMVPIPQERRWRHSYDSQGWACTSAIHCIWMTALMAGGRQLQQDGWQAIAEGQSDASITPVLRCRLCWRLSISPLPAYQGESAQAALLALPSRVPTGYGSARGFHRCTRPVIDADRFSASARSGCGFERRLARRSVNAISSQSQC